VARQKLKLAEQLSDINSCTDEEREANLKKSRKIRAAKAHDSSSYDYSDNDEDDCSDQTILSNLPKPPSDKQTDVHKKTSKKKQTFKGKNTMKH